MLDIAQDQSALGSLRAAEFDTRGAQSAVWSVRFASTKDGGKTFRWS